MPEAGYITDVEYTDEFFGQQSPGFMSYIATLNGYATPPLEHFTYCELGAGRGVTSLILAATHPTARFYACDFNPAHVEHASTLAREGDVRNVTFLERSFGQMLEEDLPDFDFITLHGVYSWVPASVRDEIHAFLKRKLKPGGLAMVSYNAMPGWAHLEPVRRMMQTYVAALPGDSIQKARQALGYVTYLADHKAKYFAMNPASAAHLAVIRNSDVRYVAHEYITPNTDTFYFPEVAGAMRASDLSFAGNMLPASNYSALMVPQQFQELLNSAPTRAILETHRDFIANTSFRNDLYAAQPERTAAPPLQFARLADMHFYLARSSDQLPLRASNEQLQYNLEPSAKSVRAIHGVLSTGPANGQAIYRAGGMASEAEAVTLIQQLVVVGHLFPCAPPSATPGWSALNGALLDAALRTRQGKVALATPLASSAHYFQVVDAVLVEASQSGDALDAAADSALARLRRYGYAVAKKGGGSSPSDAEIKREFAAAIDNLRSGTHVDSQLLRRLGVT